MVSNKTTFKLIFGRSEEKEGNKEEEEQRSTGRMGSGIAGKRRSTFQKVFL
jgi:hypothetical protein